MERRENWEKSRRNSTDDWCCWHCLCPLQSHRHTAVGKQGWELWLLTGLWCQCSSIALFLRFVEQSWAGCTGGSVSSGDVSISIAPANLLLPRLRLSSNHFASIAPLLVLWLSASTGTASICGTDHNNAFAQDQFQYWHHVQNREQRYVLGLF